MKNWLINGALALGSLLLAFVACEAAFRYYRFQIVPQEFIQDLADPRSLSFYNRSIWEYDEAFGFIYRRDAPVIIGTLSRGRAAGCVELRPQDYGGMGRKQAWGEGAALRILVFGDSFTAIAHEGRTWTDYLQDELARRLGRKVDVINMALDGIGVLQMFDIATRKIPELKPDLALFAFVTDNLTRARIWRTTAVVDGRLRLFTTTRPGRTPDLSRAVDTILLNPEVTLEWCNRSPLPDRNSDPLVRDLEERNRLAAALGGNRWDLYGFGRSVLLEKLLARTRLGPVLNPRVNQVNPRHGLARFSDDGDMRRAVETVVGSGTPIVLFHLATGNELRWGTEYMFGKWLYRGLLASLEELTGAGIGETLAHTSVDRNQLDSLTISATDQHPSASGMQFYAKAVAEAIVRRGPNTAR